MHTSFEKHNGLMTPLSRRQLSVAYRIAQALWKHVPMTYGFPSQAGLSTTSEATRSRAAADLSKPVKPKGRPRKNLTSVEPSGSSSSSSSTQPTSVLHYLPPSKKGERDPLREVIAITPRLQPAALDAPAQVDAVPASIHTHTKAETPAATASAQSAVISAAPWEMWTKDAAPSPALHTQQGNKVSGRNNSKTSNKSSNSSSSSSSASISGVYSLPSQTSPDSKPSSQGLSSSTSSSTSSSSCSSMPSAPAGHRESHPQPAMLRSNDPLFGGGVATNIGLWELPGMAPGSTPASMQELLHAIQPLPSPQVGILIARMHAPIYKQTNAQTHRVFVCDQENTAHFGFSWDTNCKARVVDVCVIDVATGDRFNTLVDPQAWIDRRAVKIHGISHKTVRGAPRGPHVWLALLLWIYQRCEQTPGGAPALFVAHNAHTDTKAIGVELARAGLLLPNNWAELCSLAMSKELLPDEGNEKHGRRLQDLASLLQVDCSCLQLHRAEVDCDLLIQVVDAMLERRFGKGNHLLQSVALSEDERLSRGVAIKPLSQTKRLYNILSAVRKWNPKQWAVVYSRYAAATRAAGMNPINDEQSSENSSSNKVTKQQVQKAKHVQESEKQQRSGRSRRTGGPDVIGAALPGLVGGVGGHTEAPAVATAGKGKQGGSKGGSLSARQQQQQLEQAPVDSLRAPDSALFDRSKEGSVGLEVQRHQQQQKQQVLQGVEQALKEELEADAARLDILKESSGQVEQKQQELQPQQQHMHELLLPESASAHSLSEVGPQAITEGHSSVVADEGVVWSTEGLGEQQQQQQQQQQQDEGVVWSTQGLGEQQWQQQLQQEYEMTGSDRWREADPLADIESAFDEQALSDLSPPSAEPTAFPREGTDQIEAQRDEGSTAIMTDATTATPTIDATATAVLEQHMAPKERHAAPTKPAKVPPVWSYLSEPPYKERMATKKWFTAAQLKKLEQSDLSNLISVLAHYPRAYKAFTPCVQPHLPEQCVEVEATVLESKVTNMRGRGQAVLSMLVQAPLAHPQYPSLHSGSSSSSSSNSSTSSTSASSGSVGSNNNTGGSDLNSGSGGGEQAGLPTTVISVTKFAAGGVWAGRQLEDLQRKLGSRFVLKTSLEAVYPGEEADCLKWFSKRSLSLHPRPQWRTTGVPDILPGSLQHAQPDHHNKIIQGPGYALEPVYPACTPLKPEDFYSSKPSKAGKDIIGRALGGLGDLSSACPLEFFEPLANLPGLESLQLMRWLDALHAVHRPRTLAAISAGRRQLAFQEMFFMQLQLLQRRRDFLRRMARIAPTPHIADSRAVDALRNAKASSFSSSSDGSSNTSKGLPYPLTGAQERALLEIMEDMRRPVAMLRLLQGDVGSGKTIVAMLAMLAAASSGYQSLLLVPTGILAQQHFNTLQNLVDRLPAKLQQDFGKIALLQGGLKPREKRDVLGAIQSGVSRLVVSTHSALFTKDWSRLGFVVIDEQHKFGVRQKEAVLELCNSFHPHILSMSATPIPRTMALVKYGEMVVSALYESPPNRQKVETSVVEDNPGGRAEMQNAIQAELAAGGRAFIVYPLRSVLDAAEEKLLGPEVEVGEGDLRSATAEFQRLQKQKVFGTDKCVLLHGGMKHEDKAAAVEAFRSGQRPVMVCTSVVEVGVDVTQASIIVVEHADRFGLAQLHQLRGRVGRGVLKSRCLLLAPNANAVAAERLKVMESCHNGLDIAEADLHLRGAGSVFNAGIKQSGGVDCTDLCSEEVAKDPRIVEVARALAANALMHKDGLSPHLQQVAAAHQAARNGGNESTEQALGGFAV